MKVLLKSAMIGVAGMGLFFCFFMMLSIPLLAALARFHGSGAPLQSPGVVVAPEHWFRYAGLPLSAAAFVLSFVVGWKKFKSVRQ
jgi:hypothetical protein